MKHATAAILSLALSASAVADGPSGHPWNEASELVFFAVLEGLFEDGVSSEVVELVIGKPSEPDHVRFRRHFVYACPLCHPTFEAFKLYQRRSSIFGLKAPRDTFGSGLEPSILVDLRSPEREARMKAIQSLVGRWVKRRIEMMRLEPQELDRLTAEMEKNRQIGMQSLERERALPDHDPSWRACAICDGSAGACRLVRDQRR